MNPFNPDAGDTPAPGTAEDLTLARRAAQGVWRLFPYLERRYGARGRAFAQSDAGFLITLADHDAERAQTQALWLAGVLAARGMPSLLLEYQLEALHRMGRRAQRPWASSLRDLTEVLRARRLSVLEGAVFSECERRCAAGLRGTGLLIASAVADRLLGLGGDDAVLTERLAATGPAEWAAACHEALAHARVGAGLGSE